MKLWQKNITVSDAVEKFTVGNDKQMDLYLAKYDVLGSIAHVTMLETIGLLTKEEKEVLVRELKNIYQSFNPPLGDGGFTIDDNVEDIHSQIELLLTQRLGEAGKKIHSGRSRNDQVLVDIKLFLRTEIEKTVHSAKSLFDLLIEKSEQYKKILLPGYTHLQIAMPSSFGLWMGAYAESLVDDVISFQSSYKVVNKNPLGSAAGYGSSFPLNRTFTTQLLGFESPNYNVVAAQMSRGKSERVVAQSISNTAATLSKLAYDCCLYMNQNFSFISFPDELTTGSSIMPHKKNPDVFELIRAKCNQLQALPNEIAFVANNLPSGYHRDFQLLKEQLFPAFEKLRSCMDMMQLMLGNMKVKENILEDEKYKYLFTVEAVNKLVMEGMSFRDAYKTIGKQVEQGVFTPPLLGEVGRGLHEGSIGNLCNDKIVEMMEKEMNAFAFWDENELLML